jgi:hypothetical protein
MLVEGGIIKEAVSKSFEEWTIISSYNVSLIMLFLGLILHYATDFYKSSLDNFKIRLSGENWAILFFIIRDFSLFASFGISLLLINPDMFADIKFPLPFFPIGVILLGIALIYKLKGELDINSKHKKIFNIFLLLAGIVQYLGFVFVMEAASKDWVASGVAGTFWLSLRNLRSNLNPSLAMWTFYISFPVLLVILLIIVSSGLKNKTEKNK